MNDEPLRKRRMRRRPKVDGNVYLRGNRYWIWYMDRFQRRKFEPTGTENLQEAKALLHETLAAVKKGKSFDQSGDLCVTVREAVREYLRFLEERKKASLVDYKAIVEKFSAFIEPTSKSDLKGRVLIRNINKKQIEDFVGYLLNPKNHRRKITGPRVNRYIAILKAFFNKCLEWDWIEKNPVKGIKMFAETTRDKVLEVGQARFLLEECSPKLKPIVITALLTGLRKSDVLGLRWQDIDFENGSISVRQKKTGTPLTIQICVELKTVLANIEKNPGCAYVFQENGKPLTQDGWVRTSFELAKKRAGLTGFRFHDLRHSVGDHLRRDGRDLAIIQKVLGHKTLKMTMRYAAHVREHEVKQAMDNLGAKFAVSLQNPLQSPSKAGDLRAVANPENLSKTFHNLEDSPALSRRGGMADASDSKSDHGFSIQQK